MTALYNNMVIQEQAVTPTLINQQPRFINSYVPQGLITTMNPEDIINKTKEMYRNTIRFLYKYIHYWFYFYYRLSEMKEKRNPDQNYFVDMINEIPDIKNRIEILKKNVPVLADCFQFYQDLRGYVTDLVECLDEKVGVFSSVLVMLLNIQATVKEIIRTFFALISCLY